MKRRRTGAAQGCPGRHQPRPRPGGRCPQCRQGRLAFNGLVQLSCPQCGYCAGDGGFT